MYQREENLTVTSAASKRRIYICFLLCLFLLLVLCAVTVAMGVVCAADACCSVQMEGVFVDVSLSRRVLLLLSCGVQHHRAQYTHTPFVYYMDFSSGQTRPPCLPACPTSAVLKSCSNARTQNLPLANLALCF